jgi:hypothetical protein
MPWKDTEQQCAAAAAVTAAAADQQTVMPTTHQSQGKMRVAHYLVGLHAAWCCSICAASMPWAGALMQCSYKALSSLLHTPPVATVMNGLMVACCCTCRT